MSDPPVPPEALQAAIAAHDAYWRVKETGGPPPFGLLPVKLQQCWVAAAEAAGAAERERISQLAEQEAAKCDGPRTRGSVAGDALRGFADLVRESQP